MRIIRTAFIALSACIGFIATASAVNLPPLDSRLEEVKESLWLNPDGFPAVAPGPYGYIHIMTRSEDDTVELLDLSLLAGDEVVPLQPLALVGRDAPYSGYQWWVAPAPAPGTESALQYRATQTRIEAGNAEGLFSLPTDQPNYNNRFELKLAPGLTGDASATLIEWRDTEATNPLLQFFFNLFLPWGAYQVRYVAPGGEDDVAVRYANAVCSNGQPYSGLQVLMELDETLEGPKTEAYWLARARCALNAGLRRHAEEAVVQAAQLPTENNQPWYRMMIDLAEADFQRRLPERALSLLEQIRPDIPSELRFRWRELTGRVLLSLGQNVDAVNVLLDVDPYANQNWSEYSDRGRRLAYARYNTAIGLLREGYADDGYSMLDMLGISLETDFDLANQSNLLLGWHFLRQERGLSAGKTLQRVGLEGPRANRGLLAYGWSFLADPGEPLKRPLQIAGDEVYHDIGHVAVQEVYKDGFLTCQDFNRLSVLRIEACPTGETWSGRYFRALQEAETPDRKAAVPWSILVERDIRDPAVAEGRLALAGVYAKLGDFASGQQQLEVLLNDIAGALSALSAAQKEVSDGSLLAELLREELDSEAGWWWEPDAVPNNQAGYFLYDWLASHRAVALLQTIRDTRLMWQAQTSGDRPSDPGFQPEGPLIDMEAAAGALFVAEATQQLSEISSLMQRYQVSALLLQVELAEAADRMQEEALLRESSASRAN